MTKRKPQAAVLMAAIMSATGLLSAQDRIEHGCFYAVTVGANKSEVRTCKDSDPLNFSNNTDIKKVILDFGLSQNRIRFKGCPDQPFSAYADQLAGSYVVTYPSNQTEKFLVPIIHELAHVLQMHAAGGQRELMKKFTVNASKRIELGADYLTGVIFAKLFKDAKLDAFQQNLSVMGQYKELDAVAHGSQQERIVAFRRGVFLTPLQLERDASATHEYFQGNIYGEIIKFP